MCACELSIHTLLSRQTVVQMHLTALMMPSTYSNQSSFKRKRSMPIFTIFTWLCCLWLRIDRHKCIQKPGFECRKKHSHQHQHGNNYLLCNSKSLDSSTRSCSSFAVFFSVSYKYAGIEHKAKKNTQTNKQKNQQNKQKSANGRALSGGRCEVSVFIQQRNQQQHQQINKHTQQSINS